jgi:hypothetical protein
LGLIYVFEASVILEQERMSNMILKCGLL